MRVPPPKPCASRCNCSCARHGSGSCSALRDRGDARVEDEAVDVDRLGGSAHAPGAGRRSCTAPSSGSRRSAAPAAGARGDGRATADGSACRRSRRCGGWCRAGRAGGRARARALAPQADVLQLAREAAHQRFDVERVFALGQRAEVGGAQHFLRGSPRRAGARRRRRRRTRCRRLRRARCVTALARGRRRRAARALPAVGAAGTRRRTVRRSGATRRRGRTAGLEGSSAARVASSTPTRSAVLRTCTPSAPPTAKPLARRKVGKPARRVGDGVARHPVVERVNLHACRRQSGHHLARKRHAIVARLDQRAQRVDDPLGAVLVDRRDAEPQQRGGPVEGLGDAGLLLQLHASARPARTRRSAAPARPRRRAPSCARSRAPCRSRDSRCTGTGSAVAARRTARACRWR